MLNRLVYPFFIAFLFVSFTSIVEAQISFVPLDYNPIVANAKSERNLKRQVSRLDTLPFVDDFALAGPFPNPDLWEDNYVFVNATMAIDPPSLGVATFDGLDNTGTPYSSDEQGDTLTSVPINLDLVNSDDLFLSFFIQRKGFGDQPDFDDEFFLEFKNDMDEWIIVREYNGSDSGVLPDSLSGFIFETVEVNSLQFLNENFQFRFRNTSSGIGRGAVDLWHLDLVRLVNNQVPSLTYQDLAFQFPTQSILNRYSAMPTRHFIVNTASHLREEFTFSIFNHLDVARPIASENSVMSITELSTGQEVVTPEQFLIGVSNLNIGADTSIVITAQNSFAINANSFNEDDNLSFESLFVIDPVEADNDPGLLDNNFLRRTTDVSDFFAYDDGTAEFGIQAQGAGTIIAVEYQTTVADQLNAIQLHFPHVRGDVSNQNFNLLVWLNTLDSEPVFEGRLLNTIYPDDFVDTLQGFTTYRLADTFTGELMPVDIPANTTFFIGWEQVSVEFVDALPVGFDASTTGVGQFQHLIVPFTPSVTFESQNVEGAVMIRPLMDIDDVIFTSVDDAEKQDFDLYPNPSKGEINIENHTELNINGSIDVVDIQGRIVHSQSYEKTVQLGFLPSGIYFITITDANRAILLREKIIIQTN